MEFRVITKAMGLFPYQKLFFTTLSYEPMRALSGKRQRRMEDIRSDEHILLLTGIASPKQMMLDLRPYTTHIHPMTFADHHSFSGKDIEHINSVFAGMPSPKSIVTTEKDAVRINAVEGLSDEVMENIYALPVRIEFMQEQEQIFNENIIGYVRKNSRNSILVKTKDDNKSKDSHNIGHRSRTISFRNN